MSNVEPISDRPIETGPRGFVSAEQQLQALLDELAAAGVELGAYDRRIAAWLSGMDWSTVAPIASWIRRAHQDQ